MNGPPRRQERNAKHERKQTVWKKLLGSVIWKWQRNCKHAHMIADVLEGDAIGIGRQVAWCPECGAVQVKRGVTRAALRLPCAKG